MECEGAKWAGAIPKSTSSFCFFLSSSLLLSLSLLFQFHIGWFHNHVLRPFYPLQLPPSVANPPGASKLQIATPTTPHPPTPRPSVASKPVDPDLDRGPPSDLSGVPPCRVDSSPLSFRPLDYPTLHLSVVPFFYLDPTPPPRLPDGPCRLCQGHLVDRSNVP